MSSPTTTSRRSTEEHRPARVRAAALREQERRAERRRRRITMSVVALLVAIVGGGAAVQAARSTADGPAPAPTGVTTDGYGVQLGSADAPVLVEVYEDFMCPACGRFEESAGAALREMTADGSVRVVFRPMAFLDGASTTRYSTRALNASACAVDAGRFPAYHARLFAVQPEEGGPGLSDAQLVALGTDAGITEHGLCRLRREPRLPALDAARDRCRVQGRSRADADHPGERRGARSRDAARPAGCGAGRSQLTGPAPPAYLACTVTLPLESFTWFDGEPVPSCGSAPTLAWWNGVPSDRYAVKP